MSALLVIIVILIAAINLINLYQTNRAGMELLQMLAGREGKFEEHRKNGGMPRPDMQPPPVPPDTVRETSLPQGIRSPAERPDTVGRPAAP